MRCHPSYILSSLTRASGRDSHSPDRADILSQQFPSNSNHCTLYVSSICTWRNAEPKQQTQGSLPVFFRSEVSAGPSSHGQPLLQVIEESTNYRLQCTGWSSRATVLREMLSSLCALSPKSDTGKRLWGGVFSNCALKTDPSLTAQFPPQVPTHRECLQCALPLPLSPPPPPGTEILLPGLSHLSSTALLFPQVGAGCLLLHFLVPGQLLLIRETAVWTGCRQTPPGTPPEVCRSQG